MLAIVFILLVLTFLRLCHAIARHRMPCMAEEQGQVRYAPRWMTVMLLLLTPIFLLPLAAMLAGGWQYGLFGWAVLTVLVDLTAYDILRRVQYHAEGFRCRDEWGRIRTYAWQDILGCEKTQVKLGRGLPEDAVILHMAERSLVIRNRNGGAAFLAELALHRGELPPLRPRRGPYQGRVKDADAFHATNRSVILAAIGIGAAAFTSALPGLFLAVAGMMLAWALTRILLGRSKNPPQWPLHFLFTDGNYLF